MAEKFSDKFGMPALILFMFIGMLFGSDGIFKIPFSNFELANNACSIALVFIMFYGGFGTKWSVAKPVAKKAILLSSLGTVLTAGFVGFFCHFVIKMPLLESFLIGSVISSTDAASVFSILRSRKLNLKYNTASLLEVESGSNDPFSYMLTTVMLAMLHNGASGPQVLWMIFAQLVFGAGLGVLIAKISIFGYKRINFSTSGFDSLFI